jgi:integrase
LNLAHKKNLCDAPRAIESLGEPERPGYALSDDEVQKLLAKLCKRGDHARAMVEFGLETGLRWSNIAKLQWCNVRLEPLPERSHLHIAAGSSKPRKAIPVPLSRRAAEIIEAQKGKHDTFVFSYAGRAPVGSIKKVFKRAAKDIGLPTLRFHDVRHSWATRQVSKGTPLKVIAELGGWKSTKMLEDRYSHLRRADLAAYVD